MPRLSGKDKLTQDANKVIVVGLDGATFTILQPLIDEGLLPNLKYIIENGIWGELESTIPPYTATAFSSFITGKNPGKHGVFDFLVKDKNTSRKRTVSSTSIKSIKLWDIISLANKTVGIINFPISYPPEKVNGFMISGFLSPKNAENYSYPENLYNEIREKIGDYIIDVETPDIQNLSEEEIYKLLRQLYYATLRRKQILLYLMKRYECDFLFVLFRSPDKIQHLFWKYQSLYPHLYEYIVVLQLNC